MKEKSHGPVVRVVICVVLVLFIFVVFLCRLFNWQIIQSKTYKEISERATSYIEESSVTRGEIRDVKGRALAVNKAAYTIALNKIYLKEEDLNNTLIMLISLMNQCDEKWIDVLPIHLEGNAYKFDKDYKGDLEYIQSSAMLSDKKIKTAEEVIDGLSKRYDLENIKDKSLKRNLVSIRYNMEKTGYSYTSVYVFAKGIKKQTVAVVSERTQAIPGVEIRMINQRDIKNGTVIPHILGIVGDMSEEDIEEHKDDGYSYGDQIGKFGIEASMESQLRGKVGKKKVTEDSKGNIIKEEYTEEAVPGNNVYLTIDSEIQKVANYSLALNIDRARSSGESERAAAVAANASQQSNFGEDCVAGGAVMLDVRDFSVIAAASCPNYDISKYYDDEYNEWLYTDENSPMFSRAFDGAFQPGSSFKPLVALAALQEKIITPDTSITCTQHYDYYQNFVITCMGNHGENDLTSAIAKSCNYYFAEVGRRTGITNIYLYAEKFGLGVKTGLEVDESKGILAGRDSDVWYPGNTCQAAIGQSDNTFTPVQLATYVSTIANNGKRYRTHLVRKITSYDEKKVVLYNNPKKPELVSDAEISKDNIETVKQGMREVVTSGTASGKVSSYPVEVAGKTGTAENAGSDHAVFICFAPYEKPEIGVAVVLEHGVSTSLAMNVAMDMMDAYFYGKTEKQVMNSHY